VSRRFSAVIKIPLPLFLLFLLLLLLVFYVVVVVGGVAVAVVAVAVVAVAVVLLLMFWLRRCGCDGVARATNDPFICRHTTQTRGAIFLSGSRDHMRRSRSAQPLQAFGSMFISLGGGKTVEAHCNYLVLADTLSPLPTPGQVVLSFCHPQRCGKVVESRCLPTVLQNTSAVFKHPAQVVLCVCNPAASRKSRTAKT
jgi:hypothetical protein